MDLLSIKNPTFLKELHDDELVDVAADIRQFLIEKCAITGGHIGPNLGVVELTMALHKEFNSPDDKFLWDVGHQAYVHKILTGRAGDFATLRQHKGLCGFPKRIESEHDVWETGHSSTSISAAAGMAIARDLSESKHHVVPIIGDGALSGGMALEALNHIGHEKRRVIVILNDNEMSIAPNVGALHSVLGRLRAARKYKSMKKDIETVINSVPKVGKDLAAIAERLKGSFKYALVPGMFFEELGFTYLGLVDGHDFQQLSENLKYAKKIDGPVIVHVVTKKGKGFKPAETDKVGTWHGIGPYKVETGEVIKSKQLAPAWSAVMSETVRRMARDDKRIVAITPAMPVGSKLEGLRSEFPDRMIDVGIAEQHATTMAAGLAAVGMKPYLAIYSTFVQRAYDQVLHDVARQKLPVVFGIDRSGLVGDDGETHQGVYDISFMRHIPNMTLMMPKDENEGQHMIYSAFHYETGPVGVRFPRGNGLGVPMDGTLQMIPYGKWEVLQPGNDVVILTFGTTIPIALEAAKKLSKNGFSVRVVNARFIKPLDEAMLAEIFAAGLPVLTVEEAMLQGGFGSAVLEYASRCDQPQRIKCLGIPDEFIEHGAVPLLMADLGITVEGIINEVKALRPQTLQKG